MLLQIPTINCRFTSKSHFQTPPFFRSFVHAHRPRTTLRSRGYALASRNPLSFLALYVKHVYTSGNCMNAGDCRVHNAAVTAKGRTILFNKVDTANGNVGVRCLLVGINGDTLLFTGG